MSGVILIAALIGIAPGDPLCQSAAQALVEKAQPLDVKIVRCALATGAQPLSGESISVAVPAGGVRTGRQRLLVSAGAQRAWLDLELELWGEQWLAARKLSRGERIGTAELRRARAPLRPGFHPLETIPDGAVARTPFAAGQPVGERDLAFAEAVEPGQKVRAVSTSGKVSVEMVTVSRGRGAIGQIVPIAGLDGKTLRARVISEGTVALIDREEQR